MNRLEREIKSCREIAQSTGNSIDTLVEPFFGLEEAVQDNRQWMGLIGYSGRLIEIQMPGPLLREVEEQSPIVFMASPTHYHRRLAPRIAFQIAWESLQEALGPDGSLDVKITFNFDVDAPTVHINVYGAHNMVVVVASSVGRVDKMPQKTVRLIKPEFRYGEFLQKEKQLSPEQRQEYLRELNNEHLARRCQVNSPLFIFGIESYDVADSAMRLFALRADERYFGNVAKLLQKQVARGAKLFEDYEKARQFHQKVNMALIEYQRTLPTFVPS